MNNSKVICVRACLSKCTDSFSWHFDSRVGLFNCQYLGKQWAYKRNPFHNLLADEIRICCDINNIRLWRSVSTTRFPIWPLFLCVSSINVWSEWDYLYSSCISSSLSIMIASWGGSLQPRRWARSRIQCLDEEVGQSGSLYGVKGAIRKCTSGSHTITACDSIHQRPRNAGLSGKKAWVDGRYPLPYQPCSKYK